MIYLAKNYPSDPSFLPMTFASLPNSFAFWPITAILPWVVPGAVICSVTGGAKVLVSILEFLWFLSISVNKGDKNEALTRLSLRHLTTVTTAFRHIFISLVSSWPLAQGWLVCLCVCVCRCALKRGTKWKYMNTSDIDTDTSLSPPAWGHTFTPFLSLREKGQKNHTTLFGLNYYLLIICKCLLYLATTSVRINQFSPSS